MTTRLYCVLSEPIFSYCNVNVVFNGYTSNSTLTGESRNQLFEISDVDSVHFVKISSISKYYKYTDMLVGKNVTIVLYCQIFSHFFFDKNDIVFGYGHEKTDFLHMRNKRRRSAVQ